MFQIVHGAFFVIKNCAQTRAEQSSCNFCIPTFDFACIFLQTYANNIIYIETLHACAFSSTFILCSIFDVTELSANPFRGCAF